MYVAKTKAVFSWRGSNDRPVPASCFSLLKAGVALNVICSSITVMTISFRTDRSGQTVQTQIRQLLEEQSDQGEEYSSLFAIPLASS